MRSNRLGCFSVSAVFSALLTLFVISGIALARGNDMFSAGPLNAQPGAVLGGVSSHAQISDCGACHPPPWNFFERMDDRCLVCHTNVATQQLDPASLHGAIQNRTPNLKCAKCHPEHRGPDAPLTLVESGDFPHETLGYSLAAHERKSDRTPFACSDCHTQDIALFDQTVCADCHRQMDVAFTTAHMLGWGGNCLACHDGIDTYGAHFDHNRVGFALEGRHAEVICTKCHLDARTLADLQSTPTDCYSCHAQDDEHGGRFGTDCAACHTPKGWEPASFDHNLAAFKLEGEHAEVACEDCHRNNVFAGTPSDCYSCHAQDDEHGGRFGTDCAVCHTPKGWEPASFDHNLAAFKLEGAHVGVACEQCHVNKQYRGTPTDCYSCHAQDDEHGGRFGTDCAACHTANGWKPASFDHARSNFPLTGAHQQIACEGCHIGGQFAGTPAACAACHGDPAFHAGAFGTQCQSCHTTVSWSPARFNLAHPQPRVEEHGSGISHGGATCRQCHPSTVFTYSCLACHSDNEGGEGEGDDD